MGLPGRQRSLTISSAIWIQCANVTDGRTDRHRATAKTALTQRRSVKMMEIILGQISILMQAVTGVMTVAILAQLWRYNDDDNDMKTVFRTVYNVVNDARLRFHDFVHS